jgi:hypothetical protein
MRVLLSVCLLAASATFASAQGCPIDQDVCGPDQRPGAILERQSATSVSRISVYKAFQPSDPYVIILPPNPIFPSDPITPGVPPNPIVEGPGNQ